MLLSHLVCQTARYYSGGSWYMGKLVWGSRKRTKRSDLQASPRLVPVDSRLWGDRRQNC